MTQSLVETWRAPDRAASSGPAIGAGARVQVADVQRGWARIIFANGLEAWAEVEQLGLAAAADSSRPVTPGRGPEAPAQAIDQSPPAPGTPPWPAGPVVVGQPMPHGPAALYAAPPAAPYGAGPMGGAYGQPGFPAYAQSGMPLYGQPGMPAYAQPGMLAYGQPGMPAYGQPGLGPFVAQAGAGQRTMRGPQTVRRAVPAISAVAVIAGALLPWFRVEGLPSSNAFDLPFAFLVSGPNSSADSPKIVGVLLIVVAVAGAAAAQLPMLSALCRLCGVAVIGASVDYMVQLQRSLVGDGAPSLGSVVGAGVLIAGLGGLGLLVTPAVRRGRASIPGMLRPPGSW